MSIKRGVYYGSLCVTSAPYALVIDGDVGSPEVVLQATAQQLQDGELVDSPRSSNRSMSWQILVEAETLTEQAEREAALIAETEKARNTWRIVAGDDVAPDTVFDVFKASSVKQVPHEEWEPQARLWELAIPASPFGRSAQPVVAVVAAPTPGVPTIETIDDCSSTSGWTASPSTGGSATLTTSGGKITASASWGSGPPGARSVTATRSGLAVAMGATPYLRLESIVVGTSAIKTVYINGAPATPVASAGDVAWYDCTGMTVTEVKVTSAVLSAGGPTSAAAIVSDISRSSATTDLGVTGRQSSRIIPVTGSMRTPGSLAIAATTGLGDVLGFTSPMIDGLATPDLQAKRTAGPSPTVDSTTVSGIRTALATQHEFTIPAGQVARGEHLLLVRIRASSTVTRTLTWATRWKMGSTTSSDVESGSESAPLAANVWTIAPVALLDMVPGNPGSAGSVLIRLIADAATDLDEAWIFDMENGRLSIVSCGAGSPTPGSIHSRLWLDAATLDRPSPSIWVGTEADRSDQLFAMAARSFGAHEFKPPAQSLFVVTTGATDAEATLTHYPRWHTWAAS